MDRCELGWGAEARELGSALGTGGMRVVGVVSRGKVPNDLEVEVQEWVVEFLGPLISLTDVLDRPHCRIRPPAGWQ